jgi:hypothetical protein
MLETVATETPASLATSRIVYDVNLSISKPPTHSDFAEVREPYGKEYRHFRNDPQQVFLCTLRGTLQRIIKVGYHIDIIALIHNIYASVVTVMPQFRARHRSELRISK